jgi:hypothetical protein
MQLRYIIFFALIAVAFAAGYFVAPRQTDSDVAEYELAALMHYTPAIEYLQSGQTENAKYILYVGIDDALSELSKNNAAELNQSSRNALKKTLVHLNQAWDKDQPFDNEKSSSLKTMPEWLEMRSKNDAFRKSYANTP